MKKIYFILVVLCVANCLYSQIVTIPDANFKAKLIAVGVDTNSDGNIQQSEALAQTSLYLDSANISDLTGINSFTNVIILSFSGNNVVNLAPLNGMTSLLYLTFSNNDVTTLTSLSGLPALYSIDCSWNPLTNLNGLTNIPTLLSLSCSYNPQLNLASINSMVNLKRLSCRGMNLSNINMISGLVNLTLLSVSDNQLTSLNLAPYPLLEELFCDNNNLYSLNLSVVPALTRLECSDNNLTSLNVSALPLLQQFICSYNGLMSLNVDYNTKITSLHCAYNNLASIDASKLTNLGLLYCNNNPNLVSINMKNGSTNSFSYSPYNFSNNPNLRYVCTDEADLEVVQFYVASYSNCHVNTYCSFSPGGIIYTINGQNKYDSNNNGCTTSDINYANLRLNFTGVGSGSMITDNTGNYSIDVPAGSHTITPIFENPSYFNVFPTSTTVNFPSSSSPSVKNFCITPNGTRNDLEIILLPINNARPGFDSFYKIIFKNKGTHTQSGTLNLTFEDDIIDFVSSNIFPTNQSINTLSWNYTNLLPFETRIIELIFNVNSPMETPPVNIGDQLDFEATINPILGDEIPTDNTSSLKQIVVGSLDPNDKRCLEGATITPSMVGQYVHYIIRFENTGTFAAENVVVKDIIDTAKFDINSLIPLTSSHSFVTRISNTNKVEFIFENINLPFDDANNDGYVAFKIKTKPTLVIGDTFSNNANIYFDYNFPIFTNTTTTTIQTLANQDFEFSNYFTLAPNPAKDILTITTKDDIVISSVSIYNTIGQLVLVTTTPNNIIDVSSLKTGSYFIKILSDKGTSSSKFLKE